MVKIPCDQYITNEDYFNNPIMTVLEKYQWFGRRIQFTAPMKHKIYMESHGIIAYIVLIYMEIAMDYVNQREKPEITLDYIRHVIDKYFGAIRAALNQSSVDAYDHEIEISDAVAKARSTIEEIKNNALQQQAMDSIRSEMTTAEVNASNLELAVRTRINMAMPNTYNAERIHEVFESVHSKYPKGDANVITPKVIKRLMNGRTDKRRSPKGKRISTKEIETSSMYKYVQEDVGDPNNPLS